MPQAIRPIDQLQDLGDVEGPFSDGDVVRWDEALGKFVGGAAASEGGDLSYTHIQNMPATQWVITHNLGKHPSVTVVDSAGSVVEGEIQHDSLNQVTLTFSALFGGSAFLN